jgi:hypothetical protein
MHSKLYVRRTQLRPLLSTCRDPTAVANVDGEMQLSEQVSIRRLTQSLPYSFEKHLAVLSSGVIVRTQRG